MIDLSIFNIFLRLYSEENGENKNVESEIKMRKKSFLLPWWFKIIAYIVSFLFAVVCLFFIVLKGISFGDEKSLKWLTSILISFIASFLITQPLQVLKLGA